MGQVFEVSNAEIKKDMGSLRGFSATRGTLVAREWHCRSKQDRSAHPTISIQPCKGQNSYSEDL